MRKARAILVSQFSDHEFFRGLGHADFTNSLPLDFWRVLHAEYGIVVYPSALTEEVDQRGLGVDMTFTDAYRGHVGKSHVQIPVWYE